MSHPVEVLVQQGDECDTSAKTIYEGMASESPLPVLHVSISGLCMKTRLCKMRSNQ